MTEQELKQWMAQYLHDNAAEQGGDFDDIAYDILEKFKQAGYVKLADEQKPPKLVGLSVETQHNIKLSYFEAGFRKVKTKHKIEDLPRTPLVDRKHRGYILR